MSDWYKPGDDYITLQQARVALCAEKAEASHQQAGANWWFYSVGRKTPADKQQFPGVWLRDPDLKGQPWWSSEESTKLPASYSVVT